jgi:hypothetical protein
MAGKEERKRNEIRQHQFLKGDMPFHPITVD